MVMGKSLTFMYEIEHYDYIATPKPPETNFSTFVLPTLHCTQEKLNILVYYANVTHIINTTNRPNVPGLFNNYLKEG